MQSCDTHAAQTSDGRAGGETASVKRRYSVYINSVEQVLVPEGNRKIYIGIDLYFYFFFIKSYEAGHRMQRTNERGCSDLVALMGHHRAGLHVVEGHSVLQQTRVLQQGKQ